MAETDPKTLTKKERKELARQLQAKEGASGKRKANLTKAIILIVALAIVGGIVFVFTREPAEKPEIGQVLAEQSRLHIPQGSTDHESYSSNPPTSGPHWPTPAECRVYTEEIPDEAAIHSLEHGAVWVSYKDKNDRELAVKLTKILEKNPNKVILSPRSKNDSAIAVVSWGRILELQEFDEQQITDFINLYKNAAPEPLASC